MNAIEAVDRYIDLQERLIQRQSAKFQRRSLRGKTTHPPKGQDELEVTRKVRADLAELIEAVGDTDGRIVRDEHGQEMLCIDPAKWQRITVAYVRAQGGVA